ncbi:MAG: hypothetical protein ABJB17_02820 [Burkholderiales bacterium]
MATGSYSGTGGYDPSKGTTRSGTAGLEESANMVKERAGAIFEDAKGAAQSKLNEQKDVAADSIGNVAQALRDAAGRKGDGSSGGDAIAEMTGSAADGLERLSNTLRSKDISGMLRDMESFARNQPVAFFGLSLAAGFLAVRFLKATEEPRYGASNMSGTSGRSTNSTGSGYPASVGRSTSTTGASTSSLASRKTYQEDPWTAR